MLTIWGRANSINVQKVLWCCGELGLPYDRIDAGGDFGETNTPAFRAMNPNGLVPAIDDQGFVLWESNTIVRYLSQKYGSGGLCPTKIETRFDAERWMDWQATTLWLALRPIFIGLIRTPAEQRDAKAIAAAQQAFIRQAGILDARLAEHRFVVGDALTMGDIPIGATIYRWYALDIEHPPFANLERWHAALQERPAYRAAIMHPLS